MHRSHSNLVKFSFHDEELGKVVHRLEDLYKDCHNVVLQRLQAQPSTDATDRDQGDRSNPKDPLLPDSLGNSKGF